MAKFRGLVLNCKVCGSEFKVPPSRAGKAEFCSVACASIGRGERRRKRVTLICANCAQPFEAHNAHAHRRVYCSDRCKDTDRAAKADQGFKRIGEGNGNWKGGKTFHSEGYAYRRMPDHPFQSNGYVLEHRVVMERWLRENEPESPFLIQLGNNLYLSPDFIVHHRDENKTNNAIGNLECMTNEQHLRHHNSSG